MENPDSEKRRDINPRATKTSSGIAGEGGTHLEILSNIAMKLMDQNVVDDLVESNDVEKIYKMFVEEKMIVTVTMNPANR